MSGAGKTTQIRCISEELSRLKKKYLVVVEKHYEPFNQTTLNIGVKLNYSLDDIVQFAKARGEIHKTYLKPLLGTLDYLIFDRCFYTSAIYQANKQCSVSDVLKINLREGVIEPNKSIIFVCPYIIAFERIQKRNRSNFNLPSGMSVLSFSQISENVAV